MFGSSDDEVAGLIFVVARAGMIDVGQPVEGELAIAFESRGLVDERAVAMEIFVLRVAGLRAHRIDQAAPAA